MIGNIDIDIEFTVPSELCTSVNINSCLAPIYTLPKYMVRSEIKNNETTDVLPLPMGTSVIGGIDKKLTEKV